MHPATSFKQKGAPFLRPLPTSFAPDVIVRLFHTTAHPANGPPQNAPHIVRVKPGNLPSFVPRTMKAEAQLEEQASIRLKDINSRTTAVLRKRR